MVKAKKSIAARVQDIDRRAARAGALLNSLRKTHGGGRPRLVGVPRCKCGAMTLKRAKARCHIDAGGNCRPIPAN